MQMDYWIKYDTRQEIITTTQIPNKLNLGIYANYYNLMDVKGIGFQISSNTNFETEKLYRNNGFEYIILEHKNQKELYILPNENIVEYTNKVASKIDTCETENDVLNLLIEEMN